MNNITNLSRLYSLTPKDRGDKLITEGILTSQELETLTKEGNLPLATADRLIECAIGMGSLPFAIATNFKVNGKDYLVPMSIEEASVVAAATHAAKLALPEGFTASADEPIMIGQVQLVKVANTKAEHAVLTNKNELIEIANATNPIMIKLGGGCREIRVKTLKGITGEMLVVYLDIDVRDSMGANTVNTMLEKIAPKLEQLTGGVARLKIISNLADKRLARASVTYKKDAIGGSEVVDAILDAYALADADPYRCATHNKGVMNGIDAVVLATGNDFRAVEAGMHTYAARTGAYKPITKWSKTKDGDLHGEIELPMAVGTVGGAINILPTAKIALKIANVQSSRELSMLIASVGLAQNFAALKAIVTDGINKGHMKLHAKNIAVMAGAKDAEIENVAKLLHESGKVTIDNAQEILKKIRGQ